MMYRSLLLLGLLAGIGSVCGLPSSFAQTPDSSGTARLDALVLQGDFEQVRVLLEDESALAIAGTDPVAIRQKYLDALVRIEKIQEDNAGKDDAFLQAYIEPRLAQREEFTEERVGTRALQAFQRFYAEYRQGAYLDAIVYYHIAQFLKTRHYETRNMEILADLHTARSLYQGTQYDASKAIISRLEGEVVHIAHNIRYAALRDSVLALRLRVNRAIAEVDKQAHLWEQQQVAVASGGFTLAGSVITQGPKPDALMTFYNLAEEAQHVRIGKLGATFALGAAASAVKRIYGPWMIGVGYQYHRYTYSTTHRQELVFFDFNMDRHDMRVFTRILSRTKVGLRPYVGGGVGHFIKKHPEVDANAVLIIPQEHSGPLILELPLKLPAETVTGKQVFAQIGMEYVKCLSCRMVYRGEVGYARNLVDHQLVTRDAFTFMAGVSFVF